MSSSDLFTRVRKARIVQVLLVYLGASWIVIEVTSTLEEVLALPSWVSPVAFILLLVGLVVILATAWVQSHPLTDAREETGEVPGSWSVGLGDLRQSIRQGRLPHLTWARAALGGLFVFWLLFGLAGLYVVIQDRGRSFVPEEAVAASAAPGVAVAPFTVNGEGMDVWREGMVDLLSTNLDGVAGLRGIDSRTMLARWRENVPEGADPELALILDVARTTGARYGVVGSAVALGPSVRLLASVHDLESGEELGQARVEGQPDSVLALVDALSVDVVRAILERGAGDLPPMQHVASMTTTSLPALRAYLEGESYFRRAEFPAAIDAYQRAVSADSGFALAHARLFTAYGWAEGIGASAGVEHLERALEHTDRLPPREALVVEAAGHTMRGSTEGLPMLRTAVQRYPDDPEAWHELGDALMHLGAMQLFDRSEATGPLMRAVELDPGFGPYYIHVAEAMINAADSAAAREWLGREAEHAPDSRHVAAHRLAFELVHGDSSTRATARAAVDTLPSSVLGSAAITLTWDAGTSQPLEVVTRAQRSRPDGGFIPAWLLAAALVNQGETAAFVERMRNDAFLQRTPLAGALVYHARLNRLPLPEELLQRVFDPARSGFDPLGAAAYAVDRDRPSYFEAALDSLVSWAERLEAAGDTLELRRVEGLQSAVRGYRLWREGELEAARDSLTAARLATVGVGYWSAWNPTIRWWLAEIHAERGDLDEAARHFRSLTFNTLPYLRLGELYEATGDIERAREAYATALAAWKDADPGHKPKREAQQALARLVEEALAP